MYHHIRLFGCVALDLCATACGITVPWHGARAAAVLQWLAPHRSPMMYCGAAWAMMVIALVRTATVRGELILLALLVITAPYVRRYVVRTRFAMRVIGAGALCALVACDLWVRGLSYSAPWTIVLILGNLGLVSFAYAEDAQGA